jgi:phosphonopyruvate decarboxylase
LRCLDFSKICKKHVFTFFTGVPDSTFKSWMNFLEDKDNELTNIIAVNECEAAAICTGYHLATGKIGVLYMQNDGFGKTVNPLTSLCDPEVYSIPILLMIGWRGEPGKKDAYQHLKMGRILLPLLDLLEIPYEVISADINSVDDTIRKARDYMQKNSRPFAIIVRRGVFEESKSEQYDDAKKMSREEALQLIMQHLTGDETIVSTTGKLSRELFEYRRKKNEEFARDFYNVGAMGCAPSIALGIALQNKKQRVFVFDGDGALLMQMGELATVGHYAPANLYHIVFDNEAHDSTGGQPTSSSTADFRNVALACKYRYAKIAGNKDELEKSIQAFKTTKGPAMLLIKVKRGARKELKRPDKPPVAYKKDFMKSLAGSR